MDSSVTNTMASEVTNDSETTSVSVESFDSIFQIEEVDAIPAKSMMTMRC